MLNGSRVVGVGRRYVAIDEMKGDGGAEANIASCARLQVARSTEKARCVPMNLIEHDAS